MIWYRTLNTEFANYSLKIRSWIFCLPVVTVWKQVFKLNLLRFMHAICPWWVVMNCICISCCQWLMLVEASMQPFGLQWLRWPALKSLAECISRRGKQVSFQCAPLFCSDHAWFLCIAFVRSFASCKKVSLDTAEAFWLWLLAVTLVHLSHAFWRCIILPPSLAHAEVLWF